MDRFMDILRKPGAKPEIQGVAPTQHVIGKEALDYSDVKGYIPKSKPGMLDRWLDFVVRVSGSEPVFFLILAGLLTWALLGIKYGSTDSWQVLISDIQAIVSYIFDSFLVRQQLNAYEEEMIVAAELESRILSHKRMLEKLHQKLNAEDEAKTTHLVHLVKAHQNALEFGTELPTETRFGRTITWFSHVIGHLGTITLFWVGVFTWIGLGHRSNYSDKWQLYMNSASSALMVFIFAFLANIRERHAAYTRSCLDAIFQVDSSLETKLRQLTDDSLPNDLVIIPAPRVSKIQRAIFYYADFVGTLVGIAILVAVIVIWIAIGPLLHFDSNWWLLIGTYAGLIGMNDGFVLRNMQARLRCYVDDQFARGITAQDASLFTTAGIPAPRDEEVVGGDSLTQRVSETMGRVCAHEITVVLGVVTILGLVAGASAMRWTMTGQLLCNVPPSLIESFFMIVLVTGHNSADDRKRVDLRNTYARRLQLLGYVNAVQSIW
ncbi:Low affinity iron permease-domain-containing protein [Aspergillus caelatus]|uniref:Low affinity iron permease-domain-containing protein n=1 Tax=Aspergillus caelatus TaxID=61420 RepID=A0A5N7AJ09_9EURO|nr:Low affinity iron permease-domain-containing protein [Aspergillus caelatus]KAE8369176.1 Low affinity iron permease-domain-containing protein [Aspergillus caelatus]